MSYIPCKVETMKIFTAKQIQEWDQYTIENEPISSLELMERASKIFANWLIPQLDNQNEITVVCGPGNNGGDGLAVARHLYNSDFSIKIISCQIGSPSEDHILQWKKLPADISTESLVEGDPLPEFQEENILIDAIFGSGLSRPVTGYWGKLIEAMNLSKNIYAIDIPSGIFSEPKPHKAAVKASHTLSFQVPKLSFLFPEYESFLGKWTVKSIGLHSDYPKNTPTPYRYLHQSDIKTILNDRSQFAHKGHFGHGLLYAGSQGMLGAALLSSRAALRSGLGLLTIHATREAYSILQAQVPEAMVNTDPQEHIITAIHPNSDSFQAIAAGPGLGQSPATQEFIQKLIQGQKKPLILDADALNCVAKNNLQTQLPPGTILTPHPGEFDRLFGKHSTHHERMETATNQASELKCTIILKGAHTLIATPQGELIFNSTGNPGMATGGTGDTLTGILLGLRTQGYSPTETAILGVYIHGLAADLALEKSAFESLLAGDIIRYLGKAFQAIRYE